MRGSPVSGSSPWWRRLFGGSKAARSAAVIVAHPDDETLWAGGQILAHPRWDWFVASICRASDKDRSPRFFKALERLDAIGAIADLDDGPDQHPLDTHMIQETVLRLLPQTHYDVILTHGPSGEYTRHRRHEELSRAVTELWQSKRIAAKSLMLFAYEDGGGQYLPRARQDAHSRHKLPEPAFREKSLIIRQSYGFASDSWEARVTPRIEAFWCFQSPRQLGHWLLKTGGQR
ncbi:MAG TPA: PIG-L family deacetylase [Phycisphaerae bacterium]|nr:PIG-L family deacetylase [Phycisphaerae bacterium]